MRGLSAQGRALPRGMRIVLVAALAASVVFLLRGAFTQLLFQAALAFLLSWMASPLCKWLEKRLPPGLAALLSLLSFLLAVLALLWLLVPQLFKQGRLALEAVPDLIDLMQGALERLSQTPIFLRVGLTSDALEDALAGLGDKIMSGAPGVAKRAAGAAGALARAFLAPVLAYYFLRDRETFCFQLSLWIPLQYRRRALTALQEMRREVSGYFRGQLLVSAATGALTALGLLIVGAPSWLLLGLVMGLCDLIPYAGPYLGAVPIVLFSLPQGAYTALWALVTVVAVQQVESLFLSPRLMSGATGLHPAYVLLLLSAGGLIAGLPGMLLALPVFVCARGAVRALQCAAQGTPRP